MYKKGSAWEPVVFSILFAAMLALVGLQLIQIFPMIINLMTLGSNEAVAGDIGGLVTISGAATDKIRITYIPISDWSYNVVIDGEMGREVTVTSSVNENEQMSKAGVGSFNDAFENAVVFSIDKHMVGMKPTYIFIATEYREEITK